MYSICLSTEWLIRSVACFRLRCSYDSHDHRDWHQFGRQPQTRVQALELRACECDRFALFRPSDPVLRVRVRSRSLCVRRRFTRLVRSLHRFLRPEQKQKQKPATPKARNSVLLELAVVVVVVRVPVWRRLSVQRFNRKLYTPRYSEMYVFLRLPPCFECELIRSRSRVFRVLCCAVNTNRYLFVR